MVVHSLVRALCSCVREDSPFMTDADGTLAAARIDARLAALTYADLLALTSQYAQTEDGRRAVDAVLATRASLPAWAVTDVLLDEDLATSILLRIKLEGHEVKSVCKSWRRAWAATLTQRKGYLRPTALCPSYPETMPMDLEIMDMVALPGGLLCVSHSETLTILNSEMELVRTVICRSLADDLELCTGSNVLSVANESLYVSCCTTSEEDRTMILRLSLQDFTLICRSEPEIECQICEIAAAGDELFAIDACLAGTVAVFNAHTLTRTRHFSTLEPLQQLCLRDVQPYGLAATNDALFLGTPGFGVFVYSHAGELLRQMEYEGTPLQIRVIGNHFIVVEETDNHAIDEILSSSDPRPPPNITIFSLDGAEKSEYVHANHSDSSPPFTSDDTFSCVRSVAQLDDGKLIVGYHSYKENGFSCDCTSGLFALSGL